MVIWDGTNTHLQIDGTHVEILQPSMELLSCITEFLAPCYTLPTIIVDAQYLFQIQLLSGHMEERIPCLFMEGRIIKTLKQHLARV
jgi:hypothetical protein